MMVSILSSWLGKVGRSWSAMELLRSRREIWPARLWPGWLDRNDAEKRPECRFILNDGAHRTLGRLPRGEEIDGEVGVGGDQGLERHLRVFN